MVERMNRTLIEMLSKAAHKDPKTWDLYLPYVLFAYRTSPHDSTQMTPFKLMYGREAILPTPELLLPPKEHNETFLGTYVEEVTDKMRSLLSNTSLKPRPTRKPPMTRRPRSLSFTLETESYCTHRGTRLVH